MKKCYICRKSKTIDSFYKDKTKKDNLDCRCKKCNLAFFKRDHGLYSVYRGMNTRCLYKTTKNYCHYGGRGIKILWKNYQEFKNDMYEAYLDHLKIFSKKQTTLERINNDGNYCKENCKWATMREQSNNTRRQK